MPIRRTTAFFDGFRNDGELMMRDYLFAAVAYGIAGAVYVCDSISHLKERFCKGKSVDNLIERK